MGNPPDKVASATPLIINAFRFPIAVKLFNVSPSHIVWFPDNNGGFGVGVMVKFSVIVLSQPAVFGMTCVILLNEETVIEPDIYGEWGSHQ